jgi:hypothetical protein
MNVWGLVQDDEDELPVQGHQILDPLRRQPKQNKTKSKLIFSEIIYFFYFITVTVLSF